MIYFEFSKYMPAKGGLKEGWKQEIQLGINLKNPKMK